MREHDETLKHVQRRRFQEKITCPYSNMTVGSAAATSPSSATPSSSSNSVNIKTMETGRTRVKSTGERKSAFKSVGGATEYRPSIAPFSFLLKSTAGLTLCYATIGIRYYNQKNRSQSSSLQHDGSDLDLLQTLESGDLDLSRLKQYRNNVKSSATSAGSENNNMPLLLADRFEFTRYLGKGSFAQTIEATDWHCPHRTRVAIKIMNCNYNILGEEEYKRLVELNRYDRNNSYHVVRLLNTFSYSVHFCLVFELLESRSMFVHMPSLNNPAQKIQQHQSLTELLPENAPNSEVRRSRERIGIKRLKKLAVQLFVALAFLQKNKILHADIKPDNLLFRPRYRPDDDSFKVKLIDFGNSFTIEQARLYYDQYGLQTLHYRAPEVLLGIPFDYKIDVWSVGMVLCEAWLGRPFVRGDTPERMIQLLCDFLGPIPEVAYKSGKFYDPSYSKCRKAEALKFNMSDETHVLKYRLRRLSETLGSHDYQFLRFMDGILKFDPGKRMTPLDALRDPFLSSLFAFDLLEPMSIENWIVTARKSQTPIPLIHNSTSLIPIDNPTTGYNTKRMIEGENDLSTGDGDHKRSRY